MNDWQLLLRYRDIESQRDFSEIVERHMRMVYAVCRRELGDSTLAEDATQIVFMVLARKAHVLRPSSSLAGWLFETARLTARNLRRQETRRRTREDRMRLEIETSIDSTGYSEIIEPIVNEAVAALSPDERAVILLRYFEEQSFKDISSMLGITTNAAEKRASRALDRMRRRLTAQGAVAMSAAVIVYITEKAADASVPLSADLVTGIACNTTSISKLAIVSQGVIRTMSIIRAKSIAMSTALVAGAAVSASVAILVIGRHASAQPAPGVSGPQIAARCVSAYTSLKTFQGTARSGGATASISFTSPNKLHVSGVMLGGTGNYSLLSNGEGTWVSIKAGEWTREPSTTMGIGACTGISGTTAATVPALLTGSSWGNPFPGGNQAVSNTVYTETVNGIPTYRLESHAQVPPNRVTQGGDLDVTYWIDQKTFLLVKLHETIVGTNIDEDFGPATVDAPIEESRYASPPGH